MHSYTYDIDETVQSLTTLRDYIRWAVTQFNQANLFYGHGTDNAWDEAVHLVLATLHLPPDSDLTVLDATLTLAERKQIAAFVVRRVTDRIPVAYLIQESWFAGYNFYVDERVLIPRSPIAELIEEEFSPWVASEKIHRILDLCTGGGCIGISCALQLPDSIVDAVDINPDALDVAKLNVERFEIQDRVRIIESDLFNALEGEQYDIIVSNPPYVALQEYSELPNEYKHEPQLALKSGTDGLECVSRILEQALTYLSPKGILIVEVGFTQEALEAKYPDLPFTWLQFERGAEGVFLLTFEELKEHLGHIKAMNHKS